MINEQILFETNKFYFIQFGFIELKSTKEQAR